MSGSLLSSASWLLAHRVREFWRCLTMLQMCVCVCYCTLIPPFGIDPLHPIVSHPIDCLFQRDTMSSQSTVTICTLQRTSIDRRVNLLSLLVIAHVKIECWWILINMYIWPSEYSKITIYIYILWICMNDWTVLNLRMAKFRKESWFG